MKAKHTNILSALVGIGLYMGIASAHAGYLLNENFDDGSATYIEAGPISGSFHPTNIRPTSDPIFNTTNANNDFDGYAGLSGSFLVLGDYVDALAAGSPAGPVGTGNGSDPLLGQTSSATFNLGNFGSGTNNLSIAFNYVFDTSLAPGTSNARSPDDFFVRLMAGSTIIRQLLWFDNVGRNDATRGYFDQDISFNHTGGMVSLMFGVTEYSATGDSAVGIDNISVVPEPDSIALLAIGLLGLGAVRRLKARAD